MRWTKIWAVPKRWKRWLTILAALLLAALCAAVVLLQSDWFERKVFERIVTELEKTTGGHAEIRGYELDPFDLRITMRGLTLYGSPEPQRPPFLTVPHFEIRVGITSLIKRQISLRSLRLDSPEIRVEMAEDGSTNLPSFREGLPEFPSAELIDLAVGRLDANRGSITWKGSRYPFSFSSEQFQLQTRYEPNVPRYRAWVRMGSSTVEFKNRRPLVTEAEGEFLLYEDRVEAPELFIASPSLQIFGSLNAQDLKQPRLDLNYRITAELADWAGWLGLPIVRQGQAKVTGNAHWESASGALGYQGVVHLDGLRLETDHFVLQPVDASSAFSGDSKMMTLKPFEATVLGAVFEGAVHLQDLSAPRSRLRIEGDFDGFDLHSFLAARKQPGGLPPRLPWSSDVSGWLRAEGTQTSDLEVALSLVLDRPPYVAALQTPMDGVIDLAYSSSQGRISIPRIQLATPHSRAHVEGSITPEARTDLQIDIRTDGPEDVANMFEVLGEDMDSVPFSLNGEAALQGVFTESPLSSPPDFELTGELRADRFRLRGYEWRRFEGKIKYSPALFELRQGVIEDEAGLARLAGSMELKEGRPTAEGALQGSVRLQQVSLPSLLAALDRDEPMEGKLQGALEFGGTLAEPIGSGELEILQGIAWNQPFDSLHAKVRIDRERQELESLDLSYGQARLHAQAALTLPNRHLVFDMRAANWQLQDISWFADNDWRPGGDLRFQAGGSARLGSGDDVFEEWSLTGSLGLQNLALENRELGSIDGQIETVDQRIVLQWHGSVLEGSMSGHSTLIPTGALAVSGGWDWNSISVPGLVEVAGFPLSNLSGEIAGKGQFSGALTEIESLTAEGEVTTLEAAYSGIPGTEQRYNLWNPFPMRWSFAEGQLQLDQVRLLGDGTDLALDGSVGLMAPRKIGLSVEGIFNLALLESFRSELRAQGSSNLQITFRGALDDPTIRGQMLLEGASLRHMDFANGLSEVNGELRFDDRVVRVDNLSASSGGGSLQVTGTTEFLEEGWNYRLRAEVERVRLRYPEDVSSVLDGEVTFSGTDLRSLLSGRVVIDRVILGPQLDFGVILASLSEPTPTPASNPLLLNMQLDVAVNSAPDMPIETTLIRNVDADFNLRLTGTAASPSLLGRMSITQGQIDLLGTRYEINRGDIDFLNPFRIDPVIDIEFETRIGNVDLAMTLSGPARKPNLNYRSDPPLSFNQVATLIAVGRSPTTDPVLAARQTIEQQPLLQTGANTILSQALSQPMNRRLQRFFGVSRLKVDPQAGGAEANPSARISTEQQITNELTLTYSYDLSSAQQQVVRVEYAPTRQWSVIVVRDENGLVGADVLFRKRFR